MATLIRVLRDFDAAEEAVQEAFVAALERWPRDGVPANPGAWITQVARNKAIDRVRRERTLRDKAAILERLEELRPPAAQPADLVDQGEIEDDRLRLVFTCCHPALAIDARVALTLRTLGGLSTAEIARAFLVGESTLAQRLVRTKAKIAKAGIPYEVPDAAHMPERLQGVLATLYLVFNEGYFASGAESLVRAELCTEAIRLTRILVAMLPREAEARGLLALMLLNRLAGKGGGKPGGGVEPGRRGGDERGARARPGADRRDRGDRRLPAAARGPRRPAAAARSRRGGQRLLPTLAGAEREPGRAALHRSPDRRDSA